MDSRRVVVTGIGALSCLGNSADETWKNVLAGKCGIGRITRLDPAEFRTQIAGEIHDFNASRYMSEKEARHLDLYCQFAMAAADEALLDAGIWAGVGKSTSVPEPERVGVIVSSGIGGLMSMEAQCRVLVTRGPARLSPFTIPMMINDMGSGNLSIRYGAKGPNFGVVSACATSTHSIGEAFWVIKRNDADIMIAGGAEAALAGIGLGGFCALKALSQRNDDPQHASRPFDKDRDGFVMAEGAGILILEEYEHAKKRGAKIYAEIAGYGATGDAFHITCPAEGGEGGVRAFRMALDHAGLNPSDIDYINAHGTSTCLNDKYETAAIRTVFGNNKETGMAVSSIKGGIGHTLGAAGAIESIACIRAINESVIPPTINYTTPDPECDLDYTPNEAREKEVRYALNTNLGFGGHNGVLIFKKI